MADSVALAPPVNGERFIDPETHEQLEYEKIVNIRNQIFAGNHPRLKLAAQNVAHKPIVPVHTPSVSVQQPDRLQQPPAPQAPTGEKNSATNGPTDNNTRQQPSEFDPVFLTESPVVTRARLQLQRQRIERVLYEQLEQRKRQDGDQKLRELNSKLDIDAILKEALSRVNPVASDSAANNANIAASDSFDENSFYSSRAPDSPPNEDHSSPAEGGHSPMEVEEVDRRDFESRKQPPQTSSDPNRIQLPPKGPRFPDRRGASPASEHDVPLNHFSRPGSPPLPPPPATQVYDEPNFSHTGPTSNFASAKPDRDYVVDMEHGYRRSDYGRYDRNPYEEIPPHDVRVVRNHITSPAAPRPARVSPLAVTKFPPAPQGRGVATDRVVSAYSSGRGSPVGPSPVIASRKRRRVQEPSERAAVVADEAYSPSHPFIKREPVTPPPISEFQRAPSARPRAVPERASLVELAPQYPVSSRPVYDYERGYDAANPIDLNAPRPPSRTVYKPVPRDNQDLRRVASLQYARQLPADYQPEYLASPAPRNVRSSSYFMPERHPVPERIRYYEDPAYGKRYIHEMSPPAYREAYMDLDPETRMMPPPQRRVFVDPDGNRYVERVQPMPTRLSRVAPLADAQPTIGAESVLEEPYERRYAQEMPPPSTAYRRVSDYPPRTARMYTRELDERVPPAVVRSASVQAMDYPSARHPTYAGEDAPAPETVRMASVRPGARYEQREPVPRMASVHPQMYMDEVPPPPITLPRRREYVPVEGTYGVGVPRPAREEPVFEDERGRMEMDGPEMVARMPRRY